MWATNAARFRWATALPGAMILAGCLGGGGGSSSGIGAETTKTIGADGGMVMSPDDRLTLAFPAGALPANTEITIEQLDPDDPPAPFNVEDGVAAAYDLRPDGVDFDEPVTVTYQTGKAPTADGDARAVALSALGTQAEDGEPVPLDNLVNSIDPDTGQATVSGELTHFTPLVSVPDDVEFSVSVSGVPEQVAVGDSFTVEFRAEATLAEERPFDFVLKSDPDPKDDPLEPDPAFPIARFNFFFISDGLSLDVDAQDAVAPLEPDSFGSPLAGPDGAVRLERPAPDRLRTLAGTGVLTCEEPGVQQVDGTFELFADDFGRAGGIRPTDLAVERDLSFLPERREVECVEDGGTGGGGGGTGQVTGVDLPVGSDSGPPVGLVDAPGLFGGAVIGLPNFVGGTTRLLVFGEGLTPMSELFSTSAGDFTNDAAVLDAGNGEVAVVYAGSDGARQLRTTPVSGLVERILPFTHAFDVTPFDSDADDVNDSYAVSGVQGVTVLRPNDGDSDYTLDVEASIPPAELNGEVAVSTFIGPGGMSTEGDFALVLTQEDPENGDLASNLHECAREMVSGALKVVCNSFGVTFGGTDPNALRIAGVVPNADGESVVALSVFNEGVLRLLTIEVPADGGVLLRGSQFVDDAQAVTAATGWLAGGMSVIYATGDQASDELLAGTLPAAGAPLDSNEQRTAAPGDCVDPEHLRLDAGSVSGSTALSIVCGNGRLLRLPIDELLPGAFGGGP